MDVDPTDFNQILPDAVLVARARDDLDVSRGASIPRYPEAGPFGRVRHPFLGVASFWPLTRGRPGVRRVRGGGGSYNAASP
jgi:hypothetical protein